MKYSATCSLGSFRGCLRPTTGALMDDALSQPDTDGLRQAFERLIAARRASGEPMPTPAGAVLPTALLRSSAVGIGAEKRCAERSRSGPRRQTRLDHPGYLARMDPPTPWPTWADDGSTDPAPVRRAGRWRYPCSRARGTGPRPAASSCPSRAARGEPGRAGYRRTPRPRPTSRDSRSARTLTVGLPRLHDTDSALLLIDGTNSDPSALVGDGTAYRPPSPYGSPPALVAGSPAGPRPVTILIAFRALRHICRAIIS